MLNQKELKKKGFILVIQWLSAAQKIKSDSSKCSSSQAEPDYVSSNRKSDNEMRSHKEIERLITVDIVIG
jgi:hypothetical protein